MGPNQAINSETLFVSGLFEIHGAAVIPIVSVIAPEKLSASTRRRYETQVHRAASAFQGELQRRKPTGRENKNHRVSWKYFSSPFPNMVASENLISTKHLSGARILPHLSSRGVAVYCGCLEAAVVRLTDLNKLSELALMADGGCWSCFK